MAPVLGERPKVLAEIEGKPILEHHFELLRKSGFEQVVVLVSHQARQIEDFVRGRSESWPRIRCVRDGERPLGTAGSILAVLDILDDDFVVMYGDTMVNVDLNRFWTFHEHHESASATIYLHPNDHPQDSDLVEIDSETKVTAFHPYPHPKGAYYRNLVNAALYCVRRQALVPWRRCSGPIDFGKSLFPAMLAAGHDIYGYVGSEYIKDCGTPERLEAVRKDVRSGRFYRQIASQLSCAIFFDRDGTLCEDDGNVSSPDRLQLLPLAGDAIRRVNASGCKAILITNQPIVAKGLCSLEALSRVHCKMEYVLGEQGAFLDRIYFCPHHPEKGFPGEIPELKKDCECRKPKIGMVRQAVADFNIVLKDSWLVGDSTTDVMTAKNAGVRSILVETGQAGLDYRLAATPDFVMPNVKAAVDFIFDEYGRLASAIEGLVQRIEAGNVVSVAGVARSGKSTLANVLRFTLLERDVGAVVIALDRWLRPYEERGQDIAEKYDLDEVERLLAQIKALDRPQVFDLPVYDKIRRRAGPGREQIVIQPDDVLIIEGIVAWALPRFIPDLSILVTVGEDKRRARFVHEYLRRGASIDEIQALYNMRCSIENPKILEAAAGSGVITVDLDSLVTK